MEGVMTGLTSQSEMAKEGIKHLGYPEYFGVLLVVFKVLGAITLIVPQIPNRIKEWAYAGFAIDFISASVSCWAVEGFGMNAIAPWIFMIILVLSYISHDKLKLSLSGS